MVARYFAAAALAGLVTAATAQRAPVTARYRVDQTLTQNMDASAAGKGKQTISFSTVDSGRYPGSVSSISVPVPESLP